MSKNFFVAEAAGLEPALLARVRFTRQRSRMSNNITVLWVCPSRYHTPGYLDTYKVIVGGVLLQSVQEDLHKL